ncbi:MAG: lytic transglycosylase domain-containing protein [Syntrophomonadaceae bacterium]|nr:lytic transglycosylase domain-containing protein [Syntrophomonadaceae bacterium]
MDNFFPGFFRQFNLVKLLNAINSSLSNVSRKSKTYNVPAANTSNTKQGRPFSEIIKEASQTYGVDENVIGAVIKQESSYNPKAVSSCGAMGLMQLMPATAKSLGVQDAFNAEQNIMAGTRYLKQKIDEFNGNVTLALAAYNAGSGAVRKYGGVPPYKETMAYVDKVMKSIDHMA